MNENIKPKYKLIILMTCLCICLSSCSSCEYPERNHYVTSYVFADTIIFTSTNTPYIEFGLEGPSIYKGDLFEGLSIANKDINYKGPGFQATGPVRVLSSEISNISIYNLDDFDSRNNIELDVSPCFELACLSVNEYVNKGYNSNNYRILDEDYYWLPHTEGMNLIRFHLDDIDSQCMKMIISDPLILKPTTNSFSGIHNFKLTIKTETNEISGIFKYDFNKQTVIEFSELTNT